MAAPLAEWQELPEEPLQPPAGASPTEQELLQLLSFVRLLPRSTQASSAYPLASSWDCAHHAVQPSVAELEDRLRSKLAPFGGGMTSGGEMQVAAG
eukprot:CAMPEP_0113239902 /NCGR_PEP_ID=MMETSP0008_2-20120614/5975_1 /TAXON_ID=97485 /ORGANISM="Prymnesium parvum" /LENGTH=95 /DNA_ID=CAMNT_0000087203 /DNA_START=107 /DNA_END=390 /DNA_ORIENTATION=- /assembly_acc=CAM_ASM_000153